jgi:hypothetical protein
LEKSWKKVEKNLKKGEKKVFKMEIQMGDFQNGNPNGINTG